MQAFVPVRIYSKSKEDIFNVKIKELPEYSMLHKMLFKTELLDEYTQRVTKVN